MRDAKKFWSDQLNGKKEAVTYEPGDPFAPRTAAAREKMISSTEEEPTLDTLGLTNKDLPTNFSQMTDGELAFMGANITLYTPEQANLLLRELSRRRS